MERKSLKMSAVVGGFLLIASGARAFAATDTATWTKPPAWASPEDQATSSKKKSSSQAAAKDLKPVSTTTPFSPNSHNISLEMGEIFLIGDLSSKYNNAIGGQLHYTYGVSDLFGFDSSIGYSQHSDGKFSMFNGLLGMRVNISWFDKIIPYATAGLGFYRPAMQPDTPAGQSTPPDPVAALLFGVHAGIGMDLQMTKFLFFGAGATFHDIFGNTAKGPDNAQIPLGGMYFSVLAHAGVSF